MTYLITFAVIIDQALHAGAVFAQRIVAVQITRTITIGIAAGDTDFFDTQVSDRTVVDNQAIDADMVVQIATAVGAIVVVAATGYTDMRLTDGFQGTLAVCVAFDTNAAVCIADIGRTLLVQAAKKLTFVVQAFESGRTVAVFGALSASPMISDVKQARPALGAVALAAAPGLTNTILADFTALAFVV